jgi:hypothetical protein
MPGPRYIDAAGPSCPCRSARGAPEAGTRVPDADVAVQGDRLDPFEGALDRPGDRAGGRLPRTLQDRRRTAATSRTCWGIEARRPSASVAMAASCRRRATRSRFADSALSRRLVTPRRGPPGVIGSGKTPRRPSAESDSSALYDARRMDAHRGRWASRAELAGSSGTRTQVEPPVGPESELPEPTRSQAARRWSAPPRRQPGRCHAVPQNRTMVPVPGGRR